MFHQVPLHVSVNGTTVVFRFLQPVSLLLADVTTSGGQPVWKVIADEFKPVEDESWEVSSSSQLWPIDEAPPEILEAARQAEEVR
jgi:hypothetical protein